jgi:hypothetical protein
MNERLQSNILMRRAKAVVSHAEHANVRQVFSLSRIWNLFVRSGICIGLLEMQVNR